MDHFESELFSKDDILKYDFEGLISSEMIHKLFWLSDREKRLLTADIGVLERQCRPISVDVFAQRLARKKLEDLTTNIKHDLKFYDHLKRTAGTPIMYNLLRFRESILSELELVAINNVSPKANKRGIMASLRDDWDYTNLSREAYVVMNRVRPDTRYVQRQKDSWSDTAKSESQDTGLASTEDQNQPTASHSVCNTSTKYAHQNSRNDVCYKEMAVNPGLHHFIHRRDAWTGAATPPCPCKKYPSGIPCWLDPTANPTFPCYAPPKNSHPSPGHPLHEWYESKASSLEATPIDVPTVPIAPPIISPEHPIRALVKPENYGALYTDFVAQGKTPKVPINLVDLTRAIVVGLRASGEWPPRESAIAPGDRIVGRSGTWRREYRKIKVSGNDGS